MFVAVYIVDKCAKFDVYMQEIHVRLSFLNQAKKTHVLNMKAILKIDKNVHVKSVVNNGVSVIYGQ